MLTNELYEINGLLSTHGTLLEFSPTFLLRETLKSLNINSIGLTRTDCIYKLQTLGYTKLFKHSKDNNSLILPQPTNDRVISTHVNTTKKKDCNRSFEPNRFQPSHEKMFVPPNPIIDARFNTLTSNVLHVYNEIYLNSFGLKNNITQTVNDLRSFESNIDYLLNKIEEVNNSLKSKFIYKEFKNLDVPYIKQTNKKGLYVRINQLLNKNLTYDYEKSYIFLREYDNLYQITIEIKDMNIYPLLVEDRTTYDLIDLSNHFGNIFKNQDEIRVPFIRTIRNAGNMDYSMNPGAKIVNGLLSISTTMFTTHIRDIKLKTPNLPATIIINFQSQKSLAKVENIFNPFIAGKQESVRINMINTNCSGSMTFNGIHNWVDSIYRVNLNTHVHLDLANINNLPEYISFYIQVPHSNIENFDCTSGNGVLLYNNEYHNIDVCINQSQLEITFESSYLNTYIKEMQIITNVSYNLIDTKQLVINPIFDMDVACEVDTIIIKQIEINDTINNDAYGINYGNLELFEYYEIIHVLTEELEYDDNFLFPVVTYNTDLEFDVISLSNIRISDTTKNRSLRNSYTILNTITNITPEYRRNTEEIPSDYIHVNHDKIILIPEETNTNHVLTDQVILDVLDTYNVDLLDIQSITFEITQETSDDFDFDVDDGKLIINLPDSNIETSNSYIRIYDLLETMSVITDIDSQFNKLRFDVYQ